MRRYIKPSKPAAFGGLVVGIVFLFIGFNFVLPSTSEAGDMKWFGILWVVGVVIGIWYYARNLFSDKGIPDEEIYEVDEKEPGGQGKSVQARLKTLSDLRQANMISSAEYDQKRREILRDI